MALLDISPLWQTYRLTETFLQIIVNYLPKSDVKEAHGNK